MWVFVAAAISGCSHKTEEEVTREPVYNALPVGMTIAVAPAMNYSGSTSFDPLRVADLMASELGTVQGIRVIGVNRVLAVMAEQGVTQIQSPRHAMAVCERVGADAILVYAITEYDPYQPVVGITAQLYGRHRMTAGVDPAAAEHGGPHAPVPEPDASHPFAEVQRVFNGVHEDVQESVRKYADERNETETPYGWRKYLASQEWYLRFCCYSAIRELVQQPPPQVAMPAAVREVQGS